MPLVYIQNLLRRGSKIRGKRKVNITENYRHVRINHLVRNLARMYKNFVAIFLPGNPVFVSI